MAQVRQYANDSQWFSWGHTTVFVASNQFRIAGVDVRAIYDVGRRVRVVGSATGTIYGTITGSTYATDTTVTVSFDSGSMQSETLTVSVHVISGSERNTIVVGASIAAGSIAMFFNPAAPTGWTLQAGLNDRYILVTSTASEGGTTGGSHTITGLTVAGTALSAAQLAPHTHGVSATTSQAGTHNHVFVHPVFANPGVGGIVSLGRTAGALDTLIGNTEAVGNHAHSFSVTSGSAGSGSSHNHGISSNGSWRSAYVKGILCAKN